MPPLEKKVLKSVTSASTQKLEEKEQIKPNIRRKREMVKITAIDEIENRTIIGDIMTPKAGSLKTAVKLINF